MPADMYGCIATARWRISSAVISTWAWMCSIRWNPRKNGDVFLPDIIGRYGSRIGWEGNIEIQEIIQAPPERLRDSIRRCVEYGNASGRFILCPSAGFMEYPFPEQRYIDNLQLYLRYGYECVEACRGK